MLCSYTKYFDATYKLCLLGSISIAVFLVQHAKETKQDFIVLRFYVHLLLYIPQLLNHYTASKLYLTNSRTQAKIRVVKQIVVVFCFVLFFVLFCFVLFSCMVSPHGPSVACCHIVLWRENGIHSFILVCIT